MNHRLSVTAVVLAVLGSLSAAVLAQDKPEHREREPTASADATVFQRAVEARRDGRGNTVR